MLSARGTNAWDERRRVTAVIVEDQIMFRGFLRKICEDGVGLTVVAEVAAAAEALAACRLHHPRILLLDLELPDGNGLDLAPELKRASPETRILAISARVDDYTLYRVVDSGVDGYIDKVGSTVESLTGAIRAVMTRGAYFSPAVDAALRRMADDPVAFPKILSPRELDLLRVIGGGCSDQDAARRLGLSALTVKTHRRNIMLKLGLHSSRDLMRYAATAGFARF